MNSRIRRPLYISFNPDYVAARSLRSLRNKYRCFQTATCLILSNHFFPLEYPFEKIVMRSNGSGYPFEKDFVDRSSD